MERLKRSEGISISFQQLRIICTLLYCLPSHRPGYLALQDSSSTSPVSPRTEQGSLHISSATDFCGDASDLLAELHHKQTTLESCHNLSAPEVWSVKAVAPGVLTNFCESFPIHLEKFGSIAFSGWIFFPHVIEYNNKIANNFFFFFRIKLSFSVSEKG